MTFQQLCGIPPKPPSDTVLAPIENEVPLLLKDPLALLLQFILLLPLHLDQSRCHHPNLAILSDLAGLGYFVTLVKMVYNLLYYQVVSQISCGLTGAERVKAAAGANEGKICTLTDALALINRCLGHTALYMEDDVECSENPQVNMVALELQVQKLCLPYLRIAALLKYHIYQQPLPEIRTSETEFVCLVHYLELVTEQIDWECFNAAAALNWPTETQMYSASPESWCNQYAVFVAKSQIAARSFLVDQHITWQPPQLITLPNLYDDIFTVSYDGSPIAFITNGSIDFSSITTINPALSASRCPRTPRFVSSARHWFASSRAVVNNRTFARRWRTRLSAEPGRESF
jgi:E3 ubiquitin-protein ligase UBR3